MNPPAVPIQHSSGQYVTKEIFDLHMEAIGKALTRIEDFLTGDLKEAHRKIEKNAEIVDTKFVTMTQFIPVQLVAFGAMTCIGVGFVGSILFIIWKG